MCDVTQSHFFWVTSKELVFHILSHLFFFFSIRVLFSTFKFLTWFLESHNAFMQVSNTPLSQTLQIQISLFSTTITNGSLEQVMNKYQKWLVLFMIKKRSTFPLFPSPYTENYLCTILILIKACFRLEYQIWQCYYM